MKRLMRIVVLIEGLLVPLSAYVEAATETEPDSLRGADANVYIDCGYCDEDYLRTEIDFVNFVRDRKLADVHVLVSTQRTGGGGTEYTVEFIGLGGHHGQADTLSFSVVESDSEDTIRRELSRTVMLGLVPFVSDSPVAEYLSVTCSRPSSVEAAVDRWDYWVFEISANTWFNGEESYRSINLYGNVNARRVTDSSKFQFRIHGSYDESRFEYTVDDETVTTLSLSRSKGAYGSWYRSISDHWSAGAASSLSSSTYSNRDYEIEAGPAVEYNIFPYAESTRRQCRFIYRIEPTYVDYIEETIFGKRNEWLVSQSGTMELELIRPWGSIDTELRGSHYLHDFEKNGLSLWGRLSLRLVKGFSLNLSGFGSRIHNLLSLPKGKATEEEVFLRRRQLATSYDYYSSVGISYSFGSIYNNIVNPRFGD